MNYRVAESPDDYQECHTLMQMEGWDKSELTFPTVMAHDESEALVGFVATTPRDDMILAGPLVMRQDKRRPWTFMRLVGYYENAMRHMGVRSFIFSVDTSKSAFFLKTLKKYVEEMQPYAGDGSKLFYVRNL
jgi:hypothetical protein